MTPSSDLTRARRKRSDAGEHREYVFVPWSWGYLRLGPFGQERAAKMREEIRRFGEPTKTPAKRKGKR